MDPANSRCEEIEIETSARKLLAEELDIGGRAFILDSSKRVQWSDASLGCPQEGESYAQVITPGYKLIFDLAGDEHIVHANDDGSQLIRCNSNSE